MARRAAANRKRPAVQISLGRAARLYRLVRTLAQQGGQPRDALLVALGIGLRTFYRELDLLRRCGIKIRLERRQYVLGGTAQEAEGRLPFPDPQLSFAEIAELAAGSGSAARRLADLLARVVDESAQSRPSRKKRTTRSEPKKRQAR